MKSFLGEQFHIGDIVTSKPFLIEILLFLPFYLLNIFLSWPQVYLLLFPLILFSFALLFVSIYVGKEQIHIPPAQIVINPFGNELYLSKVFLGGSIVFNISLTLLGIDSLFYPQLVDNYGLFFILPTVIIYHTIWYWIPWNIFFSSYIKLDTRPKNIESQTSNSSNFDEKYIKKLSNNLIKKFITYNLALYMIILLWFVIETLLIHNLQYGLWTYKFPVPGTFEPYLEEIAMSGLIWIILIGDPILFLIGFNGIVNQTIPKTFKDQDKILIKTDEISEDQRTYITKSLEYL